MRLNAETKALFDRFCRRVEIRLEAGQREYGDETFDKDLLSLLNEIQEELYDVSGWSAFADARIERIRQKIKEKELL